MGKKSKLLSIEDSLIKMERTLLQYQQILVKETIDTIDLKHINDLLYIIKNGKQRILKLKASEKKKKKSTFKIKTHGDPKKVKPQFKGVNFDYEENYKKLLHYNDNLTDGGHYYGDDWSISGLEIFYKQLTNRGTQRLLYTFPTNESINKWNDNVDDTMSNLNTAKSFVVGIVSSFAPFTKIAGASFAGAVAYADNKLLALSALEGGLNVGDKLVVESTIETFRSTSDSGNGFKINLIIKIEDHNCNEVEILATDSFERELEVFGNSKFDQAADKLLRTMEDYKYSETDVPSNKVKAPLMIKFKRKD